MFIALTTGNGSDYFDEAEIAALRAGTTTSWDAYITQTLLPLTLTVSDKGDVNFNIDGALTADRTFMGNDNADGNFEAATTATYANGDITSDFTRSVASPITGVNLDQLVISHGGEWQGGSWAYQVQVTPQDNNGDEIPDNFAVKYIGGESYNDDGALVDNVGNIITFDSANVWYVGDVDSADNIKDIIAWAIPYNPYTVTSALDIYESFITNAWGSVQSFEVDGLGVAEVYFDEESLTDLVAGSTVKLDAFNVIAENDSLLENEETFLGVNAALTLEAILGDYQVKLQLAGDRTGLEDGVFSLNMSYRLPEETEQRSFTVHHNTEVEGTYTARNTDGVVLTMTEPDKDNSDPQVIGRTFVGAAAVEVATIEYRDGIVMIVFNDETTETM
jgi:hypothetical protein